MTAACRLATDNYHSVQGFQSAAMIIDMYSQQQQRQLNRSHRDLFHGVPRLAIKRHREGQRGLRVHSCRCVVAQPSLLGRGLPSCGASSCLSAGRVELPQQGGGGRGGRPCSLLGRAADASSTCPAAARSQEAAQRLGRVRSEQHGGWEAAVLLLTVPDFF